VCRRSAIFPSALQRSQAGFGQRLHQKHHVVGWIRLDWYRIVQCREVRAHLIHKPIVQHLSLGKEHDALKEVENFGRRLMDGGDDSTPQLCKIAQRLHDCVGRVRVEAGGRLIQEQDGRRGDKLDANGRALLLPA
jgi:hypothetical protein